ncbi:MAG: C10 family peptidase, partial [Bacteroidales bacterium]
MLLRPFKAYALTVLILSFLTVASTESQSQNLLEIKQAAGNFYMLHNDTKSDIAFSDQLVISHQEDTAILLLQIESGGFIAMSANRNTQPVVAYSFQGYHDLNNIPSPAQNWFNTMSEKISRTQNNPKTEKQWQALLSKSRNPGLRTSFLLTTKWGQGCYYNELCPETGNDSTYCGHAVVGCVATAAAQIMNFWEHPQYGTGSHSYDTDYFGTQSADFSATEYLWDQMPDSVGSQNIPVATLMYHVGVAYEMQYTATSSGAAIAPEPLENFFSYSPNANRIRRLWNELTTSNASIMERIRGAGGALMDNLDRFRFVVQDRMLPVLRGQQAIERTTGTKLPNHVNAYQTEVTFTGKTGRHLFEIDEDYTKPIIQLIAKTNGALTTEN